MSWETPIWFALVFTVLYTFFFYREIYLETLLCAVVFIILGGTEPDVTFNAIKRVFLDITIDDFSFRTLRMVLVIASILWLGRRAVQTIWRPTSDLINVLGVEIPQAPDVSLGGIRADAATVSWTPPPSNRPVQKYHIQVNGIHVGETPGNETAITVTGLRPNHFYNIRVVAVGANNFQASSAAIRLRTFGKDGKPVLGNARLPAGFVNLDGSRRGSTDDGDDEEESDAESTSVPTIEAAALFEGGSLPPRDVNGTASGQRRNTLGRRHSPSVASSDKPQLRGQSNGELEISLEELNEKFESIRKEIEETNAQFAKDEAEGIRQEQELKAEKERKRLALKEKEEQTAQLKTLVRTTMEQMRVAEKERLKKEQLLKDRENKKTKVRDSASKLEQEIERMKKERESFKAQKTELAQKRKQSTKALNDANSKLQDKCAELEAELKDKGKQLQDLKSTRETLSAADDDKWREEETRLQAEWEDKRNAIHAQLVSGIKQGHNMDQRIKVLTEQIALHQQQANLGYFNQISSIADFDASLQPHHEQSSSSTSPPPRASSPSPMPVTDANYANAPAFTHPPFPPRLFDVDDEDEDEDPNLADLRASAGPLSPTAQTLLPSNIFDEMGDDNRLPEAVSMRDADAQSPASSDRSLDAFSSPHGSANNLPYQPYADRSEENLQQTSHVDTSPSPGPNRFSTIFSGFNRSRGARPSMEEGLPMGSLKSNQSHSFPRSVDEGDGSDSKRRLNFPWMNRNSGNTGEGTSRSSGRRLISLKTSDTPTFIRGAPDDSRPASITSVDMPRPSTDSGSIWGAPADVGLAGKNHLWSESTRWPSRNGSRRPSLHGSTTALATTLASADDEILDDLDLRNPQKSPSQIGVIGSRPPGLVNNVINQRLNPVAPTFMGNLFRKDKDKEHDVNLSDKDRSKGQDKSRGRDKDRAKEKSKDGKAKGKEQATPSIELTLDDSPSDSRISRDTYSVHTQTSVSESHESLMLDATQSNAASDVNSNAGSIKDPESAVRKLFRKGSSSKFSLSSRLGKDTGIFKKGPGSSANSDKNMSADQRSSIGDVDDLGEDLTQYGRSYESMTSSPSIGTAKSKDSKESRRSNWRFSVRKKGKDVTAKEKESLDTERATDEDV